MPANKGIRMNSSSGTWTKKRKRGLKLILFSLSILLLLFLIDYNIRPVIKTFAAYQVKVYATNIINDAVFAQMEEFGYTYEDLVTVSRTTDNEVTSIEISTININKIKANITQSVSDDLTFAMNNVIQVPLGNLLGLQILSNRGPKIDIGFLPTGYVHSQLISDFRSAGINQTHHQILLNMTITASAIIPGYSVSLEVPTTFILAETVIVGNVPDSYTQIISDDKQLLNEISDYGASSPQSN